MRWTSSRSPGRALRIASIAVLILGVSVIAWQQAPRVAPAAPVATGAVGHALAAPPAGAPTGGIEGVAINAHGLPVEGVKLHLLLGNALLTGVASGTPQAVDATALSAADGSFEFRGVPAARQYVIVGEHDDYARSEATGVRVETDTVTSGVVLHMVEGATIHGVVSQRGGGPLPGARVELLYTLDLGFREPALQHPAPVVVTDERGHYAFSHVMAANLRVSAIATGFASRTQRLSGALEREWRDRELDFELAPGASLPGRVIDTAGDPVAAARVEATSLASPDDRSSVAFSDADGRFTLDDLSRDPCQVKATAKGFSGTTVRIVDVGAEHFTVVLERSGVVTGVVTDAGGAAVCVYSLHLMRSQAGSWPRYANDSRSIDASDGRFSFDGLELGTYVLEARADDYADTRSDEFTIVPGTAQQPQLHIAMSNGGTLHGRVLDSEERPLADALVTLNANNDIDSSIARIFRAIAPTDDHERSVRTAADGSYTMSHIPAGTWQLVGEHENTASRVVNDVKVADDDGGRNPRVDLHLPRGARIDGRVLDAAGEPIPFCRVLICSKDNSHMDAGSTDREGRFRFTNLRQNVYQLSITPERVRDVPVRNVFRLVVPKVAMEVYVAEGETKDGLDIRWKDH